MFKTSLILTFALAVLSTPMTARADLLNFSFTGTVNSVDPSLSGTFSPGQTLSGFYLYQSTTPARAGSTSNFAYFDALTYLQFNLGSYSASSTAAAEIQVDNDPPIPFVDRYGVTARTSDGLAGADVNGLPLLFFAFRLDDSDNTVFSDALVLPLNLNLGDFENREFFIFFGSIDNPAIISGTMTSLTPGAAVPEPSTVALMATGLGMIGLSCWRRRSRIAS